MVPGPCFIRSLRSPGPVLNITFLYTNSLQTTGVFIILSWKTDNVNPEIQEYVELEQALREVILFLVTVSSILEVSSA